MDQGMMIRKARKQLKLSLKDFSEDNLSYSLLSTIEKGKTTLTRQKALMLYKKFIYFSWEKKVFPEADFEDLLTDNQEYLLLKKAHELCFTLDQSSDKICLEAAKDNIYAAREIELSLLSYYIIKYTSDAIEDSYYKQKLNYYYESLDYLKKTINSRNIFEYQATLSLCVDLAYRCERVQGLIDKYEELIAITENLSLKVHPNVYYNISLFYKRIRNFELSLKYLELYKGSLSYLSLREHAEIKLIEASLLSETGHLDKAIMTLDRLSNDVHDQGLESLELLSYVNYLNKVYVSYAFRDIDLIRSKICKAESLIENKHYEEKKFDMICSNISHGLIMINELEKAESYLKLALENSMSTRNSLVIIDESLDFLIDLDRTVFLFDILHDIKVNELDMYLSNKYYKIIIRLLSSYEEKKYPKRLKELMEV
ncbi:helix-turn-helix transcriptional regulator [Acidaminobacter sp. JC074]|uniref:helix-turn-helix domain-containing protein n=1 Tax=Acidaminobacter sp. JC074 TaxID=2530199 RepID=UPI001F11800B|nr:helix-turn-helix domain-containing protein [Acidaminobacter sp. JC074]MCH4891255.1 helix-turn-helix transcriptional regulator [Acidaminobacter sp. JC074]